MNKIPRISDFDDPTFDPVIESRNVFGGIGEEIHGILRDVAQRGGPVQETTVRTLTGLPKVSAYRENQRCFVVFDPKIVRDVLNDAETFSQDISAALHEQSYGRSLPQMNPPEHTYFRRILQKLFLPHVVAEWSERFVEPAINSIVGTFEDCSEVELVKAFTFHYPFEIIYKQLALPEGDGPIFHRLADTQTQIVGGSAKAVEASRKLGDYFQALMRERRKNPGADLISGLLQIEVGGDYLPNDLVLSFVRQLINAAGDTTYRTTGNMFVGLLRERPDQYQMLLQDRELIPKAVEETMRWESPINWTMRSVMRDVELCGVQIPAGSIVETVNSVVGRDPEVHANSDQFDITRPNLTRHCGFGNGPHICLGQHLARLEMTRALGAMLDRFPKLRLNPKYPPPEIRGTSLRTPWELHVLLH